MNDAETCLEYSKMTVRHTIAMSLILSSVVSLLEKNIKKPRLSISGKVSKSSQDYGVHTTDIQETLCVSGLVWMPLETVQLCLLAYKIKTENHLYQESFIWSMIKSLTIWRSLCWPHRWDIHWGDWWCQSSCQDESKKPGRPGSLWLRQSCSQRGYGAAGLWPQPAPQQAGDLLHCPVMIRFPLAPPVHAWWII